MGAFPSSSAPPPISTVCPSYPSPGHRLALSPSSRSSCSSLPSPSTTSNKSKVNPFPPPTPSTRPAPRKPPSSRRRPFPLLLQLLSNLSPRRALRRGARSVGVVSDTGSTTPATTTSSPSSSDSSSDDSSSDSSGGRTEASPNDSEDDDSPTLSETRRQRPQAGSPVRLLRGAAPPAAALVLGGPASRRPVPVGAGGVGGGGGGGGGGGDGDGEGNGKAGGKRKALAAGKRGAPPPLTARGLPYFPQPLSSSSDLDVSDGDVSLGSLGFSGGRRRTTSSNFAHPRRGTSHLLSPPPPVVSPTDKRRSPTPSSSPSSSSSLPEVRRSSGASWRWEVECLPVEKGMRTPLDGTPREDEEEEERSKERESGEGRGEVEGLEKENVMPHFGAPFLESDRRTSSSAVVVVSPVVSSSSLRSEESLLPSSPAFQQPYIYCFACNYHFSKTLVTACCKADICLPCTVAFLKSSRTALQQQQSRWGGGGQPPSSPSSLHSTTSTSTTSSSSNSGSMNAHHPPWPKGWDRALQEGCVPANLFGALCPNCGSDKYVCPQVGGGLFFVGKRGVDDCEASKVDRWTRPKKLPIVDDERVEGGIGGATKAWEDGTNRRNDESGGVADRGGSKGRGGRGNRGSGRVAVGDSFDDLRRKMLTFAQDREEKMTRAAAQSVVNGALKEVIEQHFGYACVETPRGSVGTRGGNLPPYVVEIG